MMKFKKIYIEITNICNLNCSFCIGHKRNPQFISPVDFLTIVEKVKPYGDNFYLHLMGEPTFHKNFKEILKICKAENLKTNITTNGTLLNTTGDIILENQVRMVSISLHSFEANILNLSLEQYLEDIVTFCKKALGKKTIVELRLWNMDKANLYDKNKLNGSIIEYLQNTFKLDFNLALKAEEKFFAQEDNNSRKKNLAVKDNIYLGMAEHFDWPNTSKSSGEICTGFCYGLRNQIAILADGTVVPCCLDSNGDIPLGNIYNQSLQEIVNSERAQKIYKGFTERKAVEPLCQSCGYMKKFI